MWGSAEWRTRRRPIAPTASNGGKDIRPVMTETRFRGTKSYLTNESLEAAVNCALVLQKPLLVRGEPGTGKTLLAEAVAEGLDMPLITWHVKSTTRAQE